MVLRLTRPPVVSIWIGRGERNSRSLNDRNARSNGKDRASLVNRRQTLCDKRENNFVWKNFPPNFTPLKTDLFVKHQKTLMLIEDYSYSSGTFFTQKRLSSVLFFPPSCCVNLLILQGDWETARNKSGSKERNNSVLRVLRGASSREGGRGGGLRQRDGWYFVVYYLLLFVFCSSSLLCWHVYVTFTFVNDCSFISRFFLFAGNRLVKITCRQQNTMEI